MTSEGFCRPQGPRRAAGIRTLGATLFGLTIACVPALAQDRVTPVSVVEATTAPLSEEIPLTGSVTARRSSRISPKLDGFVAEVLVEEGDQVRAGEPLLKLDRVMAEIELTRAQAELDEAAARLKEAKRQHDEAGSLVDKKHIAKTAFDAAGAEVTISAAVVTRLEANLKRQQESLSRHTISAPFDGVVSEKLVEVGQWVETSTPLIEVVEVQPIRVDVPVPQRYFSFVDVGTPVSIDFDAVPDRTFSASVTMKIPVGHETARTFPVRIEMDNADGTIAPGMSARVRLRLRRSDEAVLLPRDSIVRKPDGSNSVWVVAQEDGVMKVRRVEVEVGRAQQDHIEILHGSLKTGDLVVIRGNEILRPGQTVSIAEELEVKL